MVFGVISLCIGFQLIDLYHFNREFYPGRFNFKLEEYFRVSPIVDYLKKDSSLFRVCNRLYDFPQFRLNQGMFEEIGCFEARIKGVNLYKVNGKSSLSQHFSSYPSQRVMDLCNLKYTIASRNLRPGHFTECVTMESGVDGRRVYLCRNNFSFPRAFILEDGDQSGIRKVLLDGYDVPLIQLRIPDDAWNMLSNYQDVVIAWSPNTYRISLECNSGGFLFLSEMFDDGWKAELDGSPVKVFSPFDFFMGVFVPPGKHVVIFRFKPLYFYVFSAISITTLIILIFVITYLTVIRIKFKDKDCMGRHK